MRQIHDLIIIDGNNVEIWDWKTHVKDKENPKKDENLQRIRLKRSLQTLVYLYVLKEGMKLLTEKRNTM